MITNISKALQNRHLIEPIPLQNYSFKILTPKAISMNTFIKKNRSVRVSYLFAKAQFKSSLKPKITLSGDWIAKAGFDIGEELAIQVEHGKITILKPIQIL